MNEVPVNLNDLPPVGDKVRWGIRLKAAVVRVVKAGLLSEEEVFARYKLSKEEFESWKRLIENHGIKGLRVTRLRDYTAPKSPQHVTPQDDFRT